MKEKSVKKKYIILGNIAGIGGWQLYMDAKVAYLKENDWDVYVLSPKGLNKNGLVKLQDLLEYEDGMMHELRFFLHDLSYKQQEIALNKMVQLIIDETIEYDQIIIESTSILTSFWGEVLAQKLYGKHFVYILNSHIGSLPNSYVEFLNFKHERQELAGMSKVTIPSIFKGYKTVDKNDNYYFKAAGKNPLWKGKNSEVAACKVLQEIDNCDYIVGAFGTLNKPHALDIYNEVIKFARKFPDKKIAYLVVGSSFQGAVESKMIEMTRSISHMQLILAGEMYPVPNKLFEVMNVCIGSWGSSKVAAIAGVKTIRLSSDTDVKPQGVIGYTLTKEPYSDYTSYSGTLSEVLEELLIQKKYDNMEYVPPSSYPEYQIEHRKIAEFVEESCQKKEYYNCNQMKPPTIKHLILKIMVMVLGVKKGDNLLRAIRKVLRNYIRVRSKQ